MDAPDPDAQMSALQAWLERRSRELSAEIRAYPQPVARCDVQLTKLLEQRTTALEELRLLSQWDAGTLRRSDDPEAVRLLTLLSTGRYADDRTESELHSALLAALAERSGSK